MQFVPRNFSPLVGVCVNHKKTFIVKLVKGAFTDLVITRIQFVILVVTQINEQILY